MSEKRKPSAKLIAVIPGKRKRATIELFRDSDFAMPKPLNGRANYFNNPRYRVRVNGRWKGGRTIETWTLTEVFDAIRSDVFRVLSSKHTHGTQ